MITEPRMAEHMCFWDRGYPECPERLTQTIERCCKLELPALVINSIYRCTELGLLDRCMPLKPFSASNDDILAIHTEKLINLLKSTDKSENWDELEEISSKYDAVYIHPVRFSLSYTE
jgi:histone deacetylase 6